MCIYCMGWEVDRQDPDLMRTYGGDKRAVSDNRGVNESCQVARPGTHCYEYHGSSMMLPDELGWG